MTSTQLAKPIPARDSSFPEKQDFFCNGALFFSFRGGKEKNLKGIVPRVLPNGHRRAAMPS